MPDKRRVHSAIAIELFFKGKNNQRLVHVFAQKFDSSLPPSPELGTDVINNGNPAATHLPRFLPMLAEVGAPVERRSVDDDGNRGMPLICRANQVPIEPENFRKMADDLGDANHGQVPGVDEDVASGRTHEFAAGTEEIHARVGTNDSPQRFNQLRPIHFTRGFTGGDQEFHGPIVNAGVFRDGSSGRR